ncbi:unnamed protein product [Sphagnum compactum]
MVGCYCSWQCSLRSCPFTYGVHNNNTSVSCKFHTSLSFSRTSWSPELIAFTEVDVSSKTQRRRQMLKAVNGFIRSGTERNRDNEFLDPDHKQKEKSSSNMRGFAEDGRDHDARSGGGCGGSYEGLGMPLRPQMHSQEDRWWHLPDSIQDVLPLPKRFEFHLEMLSEKLGCRLCSRELLLRILVHKSYYLSKMPASIRDRKVIKPLSYFGFSEIKQQADEMELNNLLTFADAHGEARSQLALVGDTVLNLATSLHLIRQHPFLSTGIITERRSQLVCNHNLAQVWSSLLGLGEMVLCEPLLWTSPKLTSNSFKDQTKAFADTLEAYIGGIYIEKGPDSAMWCVESRLLPLLLLADPTRNPVAALKEQSELTFQVKPEYKLIGIDNKCTALEAYRIRVYVKGIRMATGIGKSQKLAKRDAAEKALTKWIDLFGAA